MTAGVLAVAGMIYLLAGITSVGVALKTRNIIATVAAGMAVILLLRAVLGWV